jgi:carbon storage regulator
MLVLSRKHGESIVIDGAIKVQVMEVKGKVVRLGIEAPKEIPVHRSELYERIREKDRTRAGPEKLDRGGRSPLHDAVMDHQGGRIAQLLAAGADVNRRDNGGWTHSISPLRSKRWRSQKH